jgi:hypothetical protein
MIVATGVATQSYTATGLIPGNTYMFKIEAHNVMGYGPASAAFGIMAATIPDTPQPPVTALNGNFVVINWIAPFNGGTAINGYTIKIR